MTLFEGGYKARSGGFGFPSVEWPAFHSLSRGKVGDQMGIT